MTRYESIKALKEAFLSPDLDGSLLTMAVNNTPDHFPGQDNNEKAEVLRRCWHRTPNVGTVKVRQGPSQPRTTLTQLAWSLVNDGPMQGTLLKACKNPICFNPEHHYDSKCKASKVLAYFKAGLPEPRNLKRKKKALALANEMIDLELLPEIKALKLEVETLTEALTLSTLEIIDLKDKIESLRDYPEHSPE